MQGKKGGFMPDQLPDPDEMLSASKVGKLLLGVSGKTVIRMMEKGNFPGYLIGTYWKFRRKDIEVYLASRKFEKGVSTPPGEREGEP